MTVNILVGDVRESLKTLAAESVQCIVTSPPYWNLRDYQTGEWVGGDPACPHRGKLATAVQKRGPQTIKGNGGIEFAGRICKCGAERINDKQIGSEPTFEAYISTLVGLGRELHRVLRNDGTFWLNMGDGYANSQAKAAFGDQSKGWKDDGAHGSLPRAIPGLKTKDLIGQAWALAFALRADGWYLRSCCIWHKLSCLPESVTDRPTINHEYMFLLTKQERYFYDGAAVRTNWAPSSYGQEGYTGQSTKDHDGAGVQNASDIKRRIAGGWNSHKQLGKGASPKAEDAGAGALAYTDSSRPDVVQFGANLRTVWTIGTQPLKLKHFAAYPERLVEPCVRAGTSEFGACRKCGAPYRRIENVTGSTGKSWHDHADDGVAGAGQKSGGMPADYKRETVGWEPTCGHKNLVGTAVVPCVVLDPFSGSGTTGVVARWLGRSYVGCELNPEYAEMSKERIQSRSVRMAEDAKARPDREGRLRALALSLVDDVGNAGALARLALELHG